MKTALIAEPVKKTATITTIYERRAVRKYKKNPVEKETIEAILNAGRMAPSAMNQQVFKFYVLTNKDTLKTCAKEIMKAAAKDFMKKGLKQIIKSPTLLLHAAEGIDFFTMEDPVFYGAPVVIFITAPKENEWAELDIGMCAQNMMLAAKSIGLDSCPIGLAKYLAHTNSYSRIGISATEQLHLAVIFGYGNETPEVHKRVINNAIFIDE
jgi:nitroreductase